MDYDVVRAGLEQAIPFNRHLGLEVIEVAEGRASVRLPEGEHLNNHVGSQHAGGLFSAGEAASGGAFVGAFAEHLSSITPLARSARIEYLKLARGPIVATGRLTADVPALLEQLEVDGRVEFQIEVELTDASDQVVARMTVDWHIRCNG
jgi:acyl-coenzyme A thioesterase PaaI-like protein